MNDQIAARLMEVAGILERQNANGFRVRSYRRAAGTIKNLQEPVLSVIQHHGLEGLERLPGIGKSLARSIFQVATTGRFPMLERLRGESDPVALLASVPGIGRTFAERIHDDLHIETLEELEAAAHDGRLATIEGFGEKRLSGIRDSLASRLGRIRQSTLQCTGTQPDVAEILDVDREYRSKSQKGLLPRIAPKRFNLKREAWLPILHTQRGDRHYTALYSNTARAHQFNRTHDWVVIYYDNGIGERQCTVVTATTGPLRGSRIVRGREPECLRLMEPSCV